MRRDTKHYRIKHGIDLSLPLHYKKVWGPRMEDIKRMLVTMSVKEVAKHYNVKLSNLSQAMAVRNIQARRVRYDHKKSLSN
jgi:hypothetical protein